MRRRKEHTWGIQRPLRCGAGAYGSSRSGVPRPELCWSGLVKSDQKHLLWLSRESEVSHDKTKGFYTLFNF
jgi:hypothetical protein